MGEQALHTMYLCLNKQRKNKLLAKFEAAEVGKAEKLVLLKEYMLSDLKNVKKDRKLDEL